jgi:iron complex outermembrane receptor protein
MWGGGALAATPSTSPDNSKSGATEVGELVITAEHRTTNLQKTAIAATVLTGAQLTTRNVNIVDQIQFVTPSASVTNSGQSNNINIRGIGKSETGSGTLVGVIIYRDGVATFPGFFQDEPFYDVSTIEVLRGPQGTFQGQNATGGAVFVTNNAPNLDGLHGFFEGQFGNYYDGRIRGAVNLPVSDTFAIRLAVNDEYHNSYANITGPFTGQPGELKESNTRLSFLWQPAPNLKVTLKNEYSYIDQGGYITSPQTATYDMFNISNNAHNMEIDQIARSVLNIDYTLENGIDIRSISGYQYGYTAVNIDQDGMDGDCLTCHQTFTDRASETIYSEELNFISPNTGMFRWIGGLYYQWDGTDIPAEGGFTSTIIPGAVIGTLSANYSRQTMAVFGQGSFHLDHGIEIQAGLRYSYYREPSDVTSTVFDLFFGAIPGLPPNASSRQVQLDTESAVTGKFAVNWTIDPNNFVYAFVATGNKPGGANATSLETLPPPTQPEYVTDFETGWKATLFNGHIHSQVGVYYDLYNKFQVSIDSPEVPNTSLVLNIPGTTVNYGPEISGDGAFGALRFNFSGSYLHSNIGTFFATDPRLALFADAATCNTAAGPASPFTGCTNLTGRVLSDAASWTANVGVQYAFNVGNNATLTPRLDYAYVSSQWATLFQNAAQNDLLGARSLLDLQLIYAVKSWTVTAYMTNVADQHYVSQVNSGLRFPGDPRLFGLRVYKAF